MPKFMRVLIKYMKIGKVSGRKDFFGSLVKKVLVDERKSRLKKYGIESILLKR